MICLVDVSQRILYDNSKAEGELVSLINSTISHEMRNPLNSIINQARIFQVYISELKTIIQKTSNLINSEDLDELL